MKYLLIVLLSWIFSPLLSSANDDTSIIAKKAQTVYNVSKFIEWPAAAMPADGQHFVVCLLGTIDARFHDYLLKTAERKHVHGRPTEFRAVTLASALSCHVVLIGVDQGQHTPEILRSLGQYPILTMSELDGFAENGGIIGLTQSEQRVRFNINLDSALKAKLSIRSQLLVMSLLINKQPLKP